jgi:DnaJ family protein C protein 28
MSDERKETPEELQAQQEEQQRQIEHRLRLRFDRSNLIEDLIEDGRQQGLFDNLPGKGKPLNLNQNPFAGSQELANSLLKDNQMTPAWLMQRNDLQERIQAFRHKLGQVWQRYEREYRYAQDGGIRSGLIIGWDDEVRKLETETGQINKQVDSYNLKRPLDNLEIYKLRLDEELTRVSARRYLRDMSDL